MTRVGQNPAKFVERAAQAAPVTITVTSYVPFLSGYYRQALDVLRRCLMSIVENTSGNFDLMVFDNGSCEETLDLLEALKKESVIQYLILSQHNVGKVGAWNFMFSAAPGEYVVYSDSDIYFLSGWLERHLEVLDAFPDVGTVAGLPRRARTRYCEQTIERVQNDPLIEVQIGAHIPDEWIIDHARSLGKMDSVDEDLGRDDYRVSANGIKAYVTATHFQFMARKSVLQRYLPFRYDRPMGADVAQLDLAIDGDGLLRLAVSERSVIHMGNQLDAATLSLIESIPLSNANGAGPGVPKRPWARRLFNVPPLRAVLLRMYSAIFRLYYEADD